MHFIAYTSRAKQPFTHADLINLRTFSASVNRVTGITGLLVFDGTRFMQALEGDTASVKATMNRIIHDPRHDSIIYIENRETESRQFDQWSMEYRDPRDTTDGASFLDQVKSHTINIEKDSTKAAFIGFVSICLRRWLNI